MARHSCYWCLWERQLKKHGNEQIFKIINQEEFLEIREDLNLHIERAHWVHGKINREWSTLKHPEKTIRL